MYDFIQTALTATIEAIAFVTVIGLPAHCIFMSHVREVQSWGTPHATPAPHVEVEPETQEKPVVNEALEEIASPQIVEIDEQVEVTITRHNYQMPAFEGYSKTRLRMIAKEMKIQRYSRMERPELITAISRHPVAQQQIAS